MERIFWLRATFASKCAWRAIYILRAADTRGFNRWTDVQIFSLGIDPTFRTGVASIFGQIGNRTWRFNTPRRMPFAKHLWRLDGRRQQG